MTARLPEDEPARARVRSALDVNLFVEAGAGAGKTTLLVDRLVALVLDGRPLSGIAAVTFTRKAAGELRERAVRGFEAIARDPTRPPEMRRRAEAALGALDEAFLGTIHAFCARLLRERPLEAGLDPRFTELDEFDAAVHREAFWRTWCAADHDAGTAESVALRRAGIAPLVLEDAFRTLVSHPDVAYAAPAPPPVDVAAARAAFERLLDAAAPLLDGAVANDPDEWRRFLGQARILRRRPAWADDAWFAEHVTEHESPRKKPTFKCWTPDGSRAGKPLQEAVQGLVDGVAAWEASHGEPLRRMVRAHRYATILRALDRAVTAYRDRRRTDGVCTYEDLLVRAADLLRGRPEVRAALGERWRHVIVDEFQDTDPVQAEVLFLLASPPADDAEPGAWPTVRLRPGALCVVGDPKQGIYRFRRADIETYQRAKDIVAAQGEVLALTANFRSVPGVAAFVNAAADGRDGAGGFFGEARPEQAAFAPMRAHRDDAVGHPAVLRELVEAPRANASPKALAREHAPRVAAWIRSRMDDHGMRAGDFMVLAERKQALAPYAEALAAAGVPVSVTGAEAALSDELHEVQLQLQALATPAEGVAVVAALSGVIHGVTLADLHAARAAGWAFRADAPPPEGDGPAIVRRGLARLHDWWRASRALPPDVVLERILDDSGLLAAIAADALGASRGGLLVELVRRVRRRAGGGAGGGAGIRDAMEVIERLLEDELPEADLLPGRADAVRVMNLHKAKGLEATVVLLVAPAPPTERTVSHAVRRDGHRAVGALCVTRANGPTAKVIACPPDWAEWAEREAAFIEAERDRLRYVAITRARDLLVVSQAAHVARDGTTTWYEPWGGLERAFAAAYPGGAEAFVTPPALAAERPQVAWSADDVVTRAAAAATRRAAAARVTRRVETVSRLAKSLAAEDLEPEEEHARDVARTFARDVAQDVARDAAWADLPRGAAWGRVVHRMLEAMVRALPGDVDAAAQVAAAAAVDDEAPAGDDARARWREAARRAGEAVRVGPWWAALAAAEERVPEWPLYAMTELDGVPTLVEGVLDVAYRDADGWTVLDWKTDAEWDDARAAAYDRQVQMYADALSQLTGQPARGVVVRVGTAVAG